MIQNLSDQELSPMEAVLKILAVVSDPKQALAAAQDLSAREAALSKKEADFNSQAEAAKASIVQKQGELNDAIIKHNSDKAAFDVQKQKCDAMVAEYSAKLAKLKELIS